MAGNVETPTIPYCLFLEILHPASSRYRSIQPHQVIQPQPHAEAGHFGAAAGAFFERGCPGNVDMRFGFSTIPSETSNCCPPAGLATNSRSPALGPG